MIIKSFFRTFLFDGEKMEMITLSRFSLYDVSIKIKVVH